MKQFSFLLVLSSFLVFNSISAQQGYMAIPEDAFMLTRISGTSIQSKMSLQDMEALPVMKGIFRDAFEGKINSFDQMGIDFQKDAYIYATSNDSITMMGYVIPLNDREEFRSNLLYRFADELKSKNVITQDEITLVLSDNQAVALFGFLNDRYIKDYEGLQNRYDLSESRKQSEATQSAVDAAQAAVDAAQAAQEDAVRAAIEAVEEVETEVVEEIVEVEVEEYPMEEIEVVEDAYSDYEVDDYSSPQDYSYDYYSGRLSYSEKKKLKEIWQEELGKNLLANLSPVPVSLKSPDQLKLKASKADASMYLDYGIFMQQQMGLLGSEFGMMGAQQMMLMNMMEDLSEVKLYSELEFDDEEIHWNADYVVGTKLAELQSGWMDSKLDASFLKYLNTDELIGYYSFAMNTEEILASYPEMISGYMQAMVPDPSAATAASDLLSLIIDEEAIAEFFPGQGMFVVTEFSKQMVEFVTYDYDENWNRTEKIETKEETIPGFLMMFSTHDAKNFKNIFKLTQLSGEITETDYGYRMDSNYEVPFALYFHIKDDMVFMSNNKRTFDQIVNNSFQAKVSSEHKKALRSNNTVAYFNAERLVKNFPEMPMDGESKMMLEFAQKNAKSAMMTMGQKNKNTSRLEMDVKIPAGEKNGLTYIMNMMNQVYEIFEN